MNPDNDGSMKAIIEEKGEIPIEIDRQTKTLACLDEVYDTLRGRLSPVVSTPQETEAKELMTPPSVSSMTTEYGTMIAKNTDSIFRLSEKIRCLLACLEV